MPIPVIRKLEKEDIDALVAVARKTFEETYPGQFSEEDLISFFNKETINSELDSGKTTYFLAFDGSKLIAYAKVETKDDGDSLLSKLYVLKEGQGKGLGKALLNECISSCADHSEHLMLYVWKDNAIAISFYEKFGFAKTGKLIRLIFNGKEFEDYKMSANISDLVGRPSMGAGH